MPKELIHSIILICVIFLSLFFSKSPLKEYDLQVAAALFLILYVSKKIIIPRGIQSKLLESVIFTFVVTSVVIVTGGTESHFFFLLYFLLFAASLLLEPFISLTLTVGYIVMFLLTLPETASFESLIPVISIAFISPLALFMGQEYIQIRQSGSHIQKLSTKVTQQDQNTLLFMALVIKNHVKSIKDAAENFMGDEELAEIKKHANRLERMIDQFEKNPEGKTEEGS
ncbi:MAG: hypothetical protein Q7S61_05795 [bacterium]|nr:hypothetical protein [bacterium]